MKLKWNSVTIIAAIVATTLGTVQSSAQKQNDAQLCMCAKPSGARASQVIPRLLKS
jgi:hypothetical protein